MNNNYGQFFEKPYRPSESMTKEELNTELLQWRNLYTWLDPEVQFWLSKVGELIRVSLRNGVSHVGNLGTCKYNPTIISLACQERLYDYAQGQATYETKDVQVKITDVVDYQFIYAKEVKAETFDGKEEGEHVETPSELA